LIHFYKRCFNLVYSMLPTTSSRKPAECFSCKVTGCVTLLGLATVLFSARNSATGPLHRSVITLGTLGLSYLGVARAGDWYPFGEEN